MKNIQKTRDRLFWIIIAIMISAILALAGKVIYVPFAPSAPSVNNGQSVDLKERVIHLKASPNLKLTGCSFEGNGVRKELKLEAQLEFFERKNEDGLMSVKYRSTGCTALVPPTLPKNGIVECSAIPVLQPFDPPLEEDLLVLACTQSIRTDGSLEVTFRLGHLPLDRECGIWL